MHNSMHGENLTVHVLGTLKFGESSLPWFRHNCTVGACRHVKAIVCIVVTTPSTFLGSTYLSKCVLGKVPLLMKFMIIT